MNEALDEYGEIFGLRMVLRRRFAQNYLEKNTQLARTILEKLLGGIQ